MTHTRPSLAAVLFDMDGTLVDSERLADVALRELPDEHGASPSTTARVGDRRRRRHDVDADPARRHRAAMA